MERLWLLFLLLSPSSCEEDAASTCGVHADTLELAESRSWQEPYNFVMPENRLIGGMETKPHAWPWTVQLQMNGYHRCGGSLIDPQFVLTAAHCFARRRNPSDYVVRVGGNIAGKGQAHKVAAISTHPFFNLGWPSSYDVALIRITPPVNITNDTRTICLPDYPVVENKMCVVAGWGAIKEGEIQWMKKLREIHIPIVPLAQCNNLAHYAGRLDFGSMICAGFSNGQIDSCQGDSGGPLMCARDGRWEVAGIVSWGIGCGRPGHPGVYANVNALRPWINLELLRMRV